MNSSTNMRYLLMAFIGTLSVISIGTCRRSDSPSRASKVLTRVSNNDTSQSTSQKTLESQLTGNPDRDSILRLGYKLGVIFYEYMMNTEIIPQGLYLKVEHSGYHQFTVTNDGPRYRNYWIKFYAPEKLLTEEAVVEYANHHPELCMPFYPTPEELAEFNTTYEHFLKKSDLIKKGMTEEEAEGALHFWELHEDLFKD